MDQEFIKSELLARPQLYAKGLKVNYLDWRNYSWTLIEALSIALIIFAMGFMYFDFSLTQNGMTSDMR